MSTKTKETTFTIPPPPETSRNNPAQADRQPPIELSPPPSTDGTSGSGGSEKP